MPLPVASASHHRDASACSQFRHCYPQPPAWLRPLALSTSQAISTGDTPGVELEFWITGTHAQLPPQRSVFTALLSGQESLR